jgi:hypothetical protein
MTAQPPNRSSVPRIGVPPPQARTAIAIGRLRFVVIAGVLVMIAGFAVLSTQIRRLDGHIEQLNVKMDGTDVVFGVKFDETDAKLDAISQRLTVQLKTMEAEIAAIAKSSAVSSSIATPPPASVQPEPTLVQPPHAPVPKPAPTPKARP